MNEKRASDGDGATPAVQVTNCNKSFNWVIRNRHVCKALYTQALVVVVVGVVSYD